MMVEVNKSLSANDFAKAFGAKESEILNYCGELLESLHFDYKYCSQEVREKIILGVVKKYDDFKLSVSGLHRVGDWKRGWGQNLQEFNNSGGDLDTLFPKDWHGDRPLRCKGHYIIANSDSFERDFTFVFRTWLYKKYFRDYDNIYEFGCGTGHNLVLMAELFPGKQLFGTDWVAESQELLKAIVKKYGWNIKGSQFDFFKPDYKLDILPNSLVYTSSALEQLGDDFTKFLDYLLAKKPALCVNVECINEFYDENNLFDYVALRYHRKRNYLDGFLTRLRELEKDNRVKIIASRRTGFGSLYHEGYMYVIWKIL
jgi:SAM-dependent methyltransferase